MGNELGVMVYFAPISSLYVAIRRLHSIRIETEDLHDFRSWKTSLGLGLG